MLNKKYRITKKEDFTEINKKGKKIGSSHFIIKFTQNSLGYSRYGIIISTKISKKAVERNKIKRQLREIIRINYDTLPQGYDIVIYTKKNICNVLFHELEKEILKSLA